MLEVFQKKLGGLGPGKERFLRGVGCKNAGEAADSVQATFYKLRLPFRIEAYGGDERKSILRITKPDVRGGKFDFVGLMHVLHDNNKIKVVALDSESEELIRELEQKGFSFEECE